jgi:hypothetical protein
MTTVAMTMPRGAGTDGAATYLDPAPDPPARHPSPWIFSIERDDSKFYRSYCFRMDGMKRGDGGGCDAVQLQARRERVNEYATARSFFINYCM